MRDEEKSKEQLLAELADARTQVEESARKLDYSIKELNEFAYIVSHDLKAPLRAVSQLANWIAEDQKDRLNDDGKEMIDLLLGRLERMNNLLEGILQFSRIGRVKEKETDVEVDALVREIIRNLPVPESFTITVANGLPTIRAEQPRIEQIFRNLLENAVKFMDKPNGEIAIGGEERDGFWHFAVADNGPGIEEAYQEKVWQLFQTLAARDDVEGAGIGLTLVKKIVEVAGGRVWLESEVGKGSTFYWTLPKAGVSQ
jgi:two-component system, LuxR family, sensor kinase FixL